MAPKEDPKIRPLTAADERKFMFYSSKEVFGQLGEANFKVYTHPIFLALWLGLATLGAQYMDWLPKQLVWPPTFYTILTILSPLRAYAAILLPFIFAIDWINRPYFDDWMKSVLKRPDMVSPTRYYGLSDASGAFVLDRGEQFMGLIAVDASVSSEDNTEVTDDSSEYKPQKGTSSTAVIRHLFVEEEFRPSGVQEDLLSDALKRAFSNPKVTVVKAQDSGALTAWKRRCLVDAGFQKTKDLHKVGFFNWTVCELSLSRDKWLSRRSK